VTKRSQFAWKWFRVKDLRGWLGSIRGRGGLGLELFEGGEGAVTGAANGIVAVLKAGEGVAAAGEGVAEGEIGFGAAVFVVDDGLPGLIFGGGEAADCPNIAVTDRPLLDTMRIVRDGALLSVVASTYLLVLLHILRALS